MTSNPEWSFLRVTNIILFPLNRIIAASAHHTRRWSLTTEGRTLTKTQVFSRELPLMVVGQLGGVNVHIVISMDALDDFPLDLVFGFLL